MPSTVKNNIINPRKGALKKIWKKSADLKKKSKIYKNFIKILKLKK